MEVTKVQELQASLIPLTEFLNKAKYLGLFLGTWLLIMWLAYAREQQVL